MEWGGAVVVVLVGLLSYQMPIYVARLIGQEAALNHLWRVIEQDGIPGKILFTVFYMIAGFILWAGPVLFLISFIHPKSAPTMRKHAASLMGRLFFFLRPLFFLIERRYDAWNGERLERRHLKSVYQQDFANQFPAFQQFYNYYKWLNSEGYTDPREPFTASSDRAADAEILLGLPGRYDLNDLTKRYYALMKLVHPDIAGPNDLARRITDARNIIRAKKGWK